MKLKEAENKNSILAKIPYVLIMLFASAFSIIIAILAIKLTVYFDVKINFASESCLFRSESLMLNVFLTIAAFVIFYIIYKFINKINSKILFVLAITITTVLGFVWVNTIKLKPVADQLMVKDCATSILDNKLEEILGPRTILE